MTRCGLACSCFVRSSSQRSPPSAIVKKKAAQVRAQRLAALSELEHSSLVSKEFREPLGQVPVIIAQSLGLEYNSVAEHLATRDAFLLVAGAGWKKGTIGHAL